MQRAGRLLVQELVEKTDVGKGSPGHYRVVAAARSVRVKISWVQAAGRERWWDTLTRPVTLFHYRFLSFAVQKNTRLGLCRHKEMTDKCSSPPTGQVARCRAVTGDVPCRRDVVGGHRVPKVQKYIGICYGLGWLQLLCLERTGLISADNEGQ